MSLRTWRNWSDSAAMSPVRVVHPRSVDDLRSVVAEATAEGLGVKAPGSGHSFTPIALTEGVMVSLARLNDMVLVDAATGLVTVEAGMTLRRLNPILHSYGLALPNLGDIDGQTIAGAIATGTHGTGVRGRGSRLLSRRSTSCCRRRARLVLRRTTSRSCSRRRGSASGRSVSSPGDRCSACPLSALHAIEEPMPLDVVLDNLDDLVDDNDHFEFYWFPHTTLTRPSGTTGSRPGPARTTAAAPRAWSTTSCCANTVFGWVNGSGRPAPILVPRMNRVCRAGV